MTPRCPTCGHKQKETSLRYVELSKRGLTNTEIANLMEVSPQAVSHVLLLRGIRHRHYRKRTT